MSNIGAAMGILLLLLEWPRMARAGAELGTTFALACELQADWKLPAA